MSEPTDHERSFTDWLHTLTQKEDRAALAALRRGLGKPPGDAPEMHRFILRWLPGNTNPWQEEPYYLVASLFAFHQKAMRGGNLGASFSRLARAVESDSTEKRFVALLNCHRDDLPNHLRHAVGLLKSKEVPIDWAQLLHDIKGWDWESRTVQRDWARGFWGRPADSDAESAENTVEISESDHLEA